jgi:AcrR family transcriptional regulator
MNLDSAGKKKPQRLKERLREVTSAAILEAAERVLQEQGMTAPMEVIAARAGVAVGTLYNHFKDRHALVEELRESHRRQLAEDVKAAEVRGAKLPPREQLTEMLQAMVSAWSKIYLVIKSTEQLPNAKSRAETRERVAKLFAGVLSRGRAQGLFAADPDSLQVVALMGLIQSFFALATDDPKAMPKELLAERVVEAFIHGAAPRPHRKARP